MSESHAFLNAIFVFIGTESHGTWLPDSVARDKLGYLLSGRWPLKDREPTQRETTLPRLLAGGDVRAGSTKRVGFAVGDRSLAVTCVHKFRAGTVSEVSAFVRHDLQRFNVRVVLGVVCDKRRPMAQCGGCDPGIAALDAFSDAPALRGDIRPLLRHFTIIRKHDKSRQQRIHRLLPILAPPSNYCPQSKSCHGLEADA
jgi:hypothetical protein